MFWIGLSIGIFIGGALGFLTAALLMMARPGERTDFDSCSYDPEIQSGDYSSGQEKPTSTSTPMSSAKQVWTGPPPPKHERA